MNVAIIGGHGFIGRHIARAVEDNNDSPIVYARDARGRECVDLARAESSDTWRKRLADAKIEAVIHCVGVLRASETEYDAIHHRSPAGIAHACRELRIPFLHIGVLGFYDSPLTPYFRSKRYGEEAIRMANPGAIILRPSVVFGLDSPATQIMLAQAKSPLCVLPRDTKSIAPIHIDDLAELCAYLVTTIRAQGRDIDVVGEREMSIADYIAVLRATSDRAPALQLRLPNRWFRALARAGAAMGSKTFCPEVIDLMMHAHVGQPGAISHWLHRPPRAVSTFVSTSGTMQNTHTTPRRLPRLEQKRA